MLGEEGRLGLKINGRRLAGLSRWEVTVLWVSQSAGTIAIGVLTKTKRLGFESRALLTMDLRYNGKRTKVWKCSG